METNHHLKFRLVVVTRMHRYFAPECTATLHQNAPLLCTRMHRYFAPECEKLYCKLLRLCIPQKNQDLVSETCTFRQSGAAYTHMK